MATQTTRLSSYLARLTYTEPRIQHLKDAKAKAKARWLRAIPHFNEPFLFKIVAHEYACTRHYHIHKTRLESEYVRPNRRQSLL